MAPEPYTLRNPRDGAIMGHTLTYPKVDSPSDFASFGPSDFEGLRGIFFILLSLFRITRRRCVGSCDTVATPFVSLPNHQITVTVIVIQHKPSQNHVPIVMTGTIL
jgi:hypothetical protein